MLKLTQQDYEWKERHHSFVSPPPHEPVVNPENVVIELARIQYTPAAMILELSEQTASMDRMMKGLANK